MWHHSCLNLEPKNLFYSAGNNRECSHKPHNPHIIEVAEVVVVEVATGMLAVQVREDTTMMVAKGADTAHINWSWYRL